MIPAGEQTWLDSPRTQAAIERLRGLIGVPLGPKEPYFNTEASKDGIKHFVDGIGDPNPLWRDEAYARTTRWGDIIAPPSYLYTIYDPGAGQALMENTIESPVALFAGNRWEWYQPISRGDSFTFTQTLTDIGEKLTRSFGKMLTFTALTVYRNQRGEVVGQAEGWVFRSDRPTSQEQGKRRPVATYTPEQLAAIRHAYDAEEIRGSTPRYWEDVSIGDVLTTVVKGPLAQMDLVAFQVGRASPLVKAHKLFHEYRERYRDQMHVDPRTGLIENPQLQHTDEEQARSAGFTAGYDWGGQRMSWLINLLTHWIGDDGFLKKLDVRVREPNFLGDTTWLKGRVTAKRTEGEDYVAEIDCWGENQDGLITMPGTAVVKLPSREQG